MYSSFNHLHHTESAISYNEPNYKYIRTSTDNAIEPSPDEYLAFCHDILEALDGPVNEYTVDNVKNILIEFGFDKEDLHIKNSKILSIIQTIRDMHVSLSDTPSIVNKIANDIYNLIKDISNELRKDRLYRKSASAQLTASADKLEKDLSSNDQITTSTSYAEIWLRLAIFIGEVKEDYVDFYADLMQKYTEMYESFNENVQKASSEAVSAGDDGNNVSFDTGKMQAGYDAFQRDVDKLNSELGSIKDWESMTEDEKRRMVITLEPAYKVDNNGKISFNMDQYQSVSGSYPSGIKDGKVSTASYQAWLATFNAAGNAFQSNMQSFAQRYTQANNNFDTLNKILSSAISTLADSARDVFKSLS